MRIYSLLKLETAVAAATGYGRRSSSPTRSPRSQRQPESARPAAQTGPGDRGAAAKTHRARERRTVARDHGVATARRRARAPAGGFGRSGAPREPDAEERAAPLGQTSGCAATAPPRSQASATSAVASRAPASAAASSACAVVAARAAAESRAATRLRRGAAYCRGGSARACPPSSADRPRGARAGGASGRARSRARSSALA